MGGLSLYQRWAGSGTEPVPPVHHLLSEPCHRVSFCGGGGGRGFLTPDAVPKWAHVEKSHGEAGFCSSQGCLGSGRGGDSGGWPPSHQRMLPSLPSQVGTPGRALVSQEHVPSQAQCPSRGAGHPAHSKAPGAHAGPRMEGGERDLDGETGTRLGTPAWSPHPRTRTVTPAPLGCRRDAQDPGWRDMRQIKRPQGAKAKVGGSERKCGAQTLGPTVTSSVASRFASWGGVPPGPWITTGPSEASQP